MAKRIKFVVYQDDNEEWRWTLVSSNGKIIADSGEGYQKKSHCIKMANRIKELAEEAVIVINE